MKTKRISGDVAENLGEIGQALAVLAADLHDLTAQFGASLHLSESKAEEHARLQRRTQQLIAETARLHTAPFSLLEHREHRRQLDQHQRDLRAHRQRAEPEPPVARTPRKATRG